MKPIEEAELSAEQVAELKGKLQTKYDSLSREVREIEAELTKQENNEDQGAPDEVDRSSYEEQVQRSQIVLAGKKNLLTEIGDALERIETGDYGICEETEEPIGFKRLSAQPWTRLSLEAQQELELRNKSARGNGAGAGGFPAGF